MADRSELFDDVLQAKQARIASLTEAVRVLTEALEKCEGEIRATLSGHLDTSALNDARMDARAALTTAKELTK